jgi:hypothetical protein
MIIEAMVSPNRKVKIGPKSSNMKNRHNPSITAAIITAINVCQMLILISKIFILKILYPERNFTHHPNPVE